VLQMQGYSDIVHCMSEPFTTKHSVVSINPVRLRRKLHTIDEGPLQADAGAAPAVLPLQGTASTCGRQEPAHLRKLLAARGRLMQAGICMVYAAEAPPQPACSQSVLWQSVVHSKLAEQICFVPTT
jgi:hypothetical protein